MQKIVPRLLLLACLICLIHASGMGQRVTTVGSWTPYLGYDHVKQILRDGDLFYMNTGGGFYTWNHNTDEYTTYSPIDGLSDVDASAMFLDTASDQVFLGYEDGMVNYFDKPFGQVHYLTDIQRTELFTGKKINQFQVHEGLLYIATDFGVVIFDIEKEETKSSVTKVADNPSGSPVNDMLVYKDTLYLCLGERGLYYTHLNQSNITVPTLWNRVDESMGVNGGAADHIAALEDQLFAMVGDSCYNKRPGEVWELGPMPHVDMSYFEVIDSVLIGGYGNYLRFHNYWDPPQKLVVTERGFTTAYRDSAFTLYGDPSTSLRMLVEPDSFVEVHPDGPHLNVITEMGVGNGQVFVAPQGQSGANSAPLYSASGFFYYQQGEGWTNYNVEDELDRDSIYRDFARLHFDPSSNTCYFGSWGQGIIEFREGELIKNYMSTNSNLSPSFNAAQSEETRVSGLAMDQAGNVWSVAILADANINVIEPDGEITQFNVPGMLPVDLMVDDWDQKWIINNQLGLVVFDENGTLDYTGDDQWRTLTTASGNGGLPDNTVNALAKDRNGRIWVGTSRGVVVFAKPNRVFESGFVDASCPVIDGFCLLKDLSISAIEVDGANRKWIGTDNGIYVVNPQGNRLIDHLTTENSPLFSDEIRDIKIDPTTGEIFIGTSKGLLSLMGDAIEGKETSEEVYVYPNPIPADYEGQVAITCTVRDGTVKVTNAVGMLVRQVEALGGQAVWDGRDEAGNALSPGVYLAMVADQDGNSAGIAKFVVLERQP